MVSVSYTQLDVYKRQLLSSSLSSSYLAAIRILAFHFL